MLNFCLLSFRTTATSPDPLEVPSFITLTSFCSWPVGHPCTCTCIRSTRRLMTSKGKWISSTCMSALWFLPLTMHYIFLLDIRNGVSSNWQDPLKAQLQQTSPPCLPAMISSLVSFFCCYYWPWNRNIRVWSAGMSLRAKWTLSSFAWRISLDHLQANHSNQPELHETFTCCLKGFHCWLNLQIHHMSLMFQKSLHYLVGIYLVCTS